VEIGVIVTGAGAAVIVCLVLEVVTGLWWANELVVKKAIAVVGVAVDGGGYMQGEGSLLLYGDNIVVACVWEVYPL